VVVTGPPAPDDPLLQAARRCGLLADVLGDVGRRVAQLAEQLARDWPDANGREWAERTARVGGALEREAVAAEELGAAYARQQAAETDDPSCASPPITGAGGVPGRRTGIRLGGTDAVRVEDEHGMRIAELEPPT